MFARCETLCGCNRPSQEQMIYICLGSLSVMVAGCSYGWVTPLLASFHDPHGALPMSHQQSSWVVALIEFGNLFTSIPAGLLVDRWGRKSLLISTAPLFIISWLLVIFTRSVLVLYLVRTIQGLAMGVIFTVLPIYLAEISSPHIRGALTTFFEGMWYLGFLFQYVSGPYMSYSSYNLLTLSVPVVFLLTFIWIPESPHFFLLNDQEDNAVSSLSWLRATDDVHDELHSIKESLEEEYTVGRTSADLKALLIVEIVILTKFMSGISAVLAYASDMFASSGDSYMSADHYTIIMGLVFLLTTVLAGSLVDKVGRRPLLLFSCVGCGLTELFAGLFCLLETRSPGPGYSWLFLASVMGYCVIFSLGLGPVANTYKGEIFPSASKGWGSGLTTMTDTISCFLCLKMYQVVADSFGVFLNFWIFSAFSFFGAIVIYYIVPETKGKTFSEIQKMLNPPKTTTVVKYSFEPPQDVVSSDR